MKERNLVFAWKRRKTSMASKSQPPSLFRFSFFASCFSHFSGFLSISLEKSVRCSLGCVDKEKLRSTKIEAKSTSNALFADNGHRTTIRRPPIPESFLLFPPISLDSPRHSPPSFLNGKNFASGVLSRSCNPIVRRLQNTARCPKSPLPNSKKQAGEKRFCRCYTGCRSQTFIHKSLTVNYHLLVFLAVVSFGSGGGQTQRLGQRGRTRGRILGVRG